MKLSVRLVDIESPILVMTSVSEYFSVQHFDSVVPSLSFLSWWSSIRDGSFALGGGGSFPGSGVIRQWCGGLLLGSSNLHLGF